MGNAVSAGDNGAAAEKLVNSTGRAFQSAPTPQLSRNSISILIVTVVSICRNFEGIESWVLVRKLSPPQQEPPPP
ncbi:MAG: hypothetical protein ACE5JX_06900 [Acidobacteriota bacterium]